MAEGSDSISESFDSDDSESFEEPNRTSSSTNSKTPKKGDKGKARDDSSDDEDSKSSSTTKKKEKTSWWGRKKRGIASAAASSSMGKALFNKFVDPDTKHLLKAIIKVVAKQDGKKKASKVRKDIMKTAVKVIMLYEEKKVTDEDFESMQFLFRRTCAGVRNAYQGRSLNVDQESIAERVSGHLTSFSSGVIKVIKPFVRQHSLSRLEDLLGYLANPAFLLRAFKLEEFQTIAMVLSSYLQNSQ